MTIRTKKSGQVGCLLGVMPCPGKKGGYGKNAIVLYAVDPASVNQQNDGIRYALCQARVRDVEFVDKFPWEDNLEDDIPTGVVQTEKRSPSKRTSKRFEASKEFAAMATSAKSDRKTKAKKKETVK